MDKETIAKMQETLAGMKTKAEGIKTDLGNMKAPDAQSTQGTILDILTKKILGDSGGVSSANTGIDTMFSDAIASAKGVQEAGAARIGLEAGEMAGDIKTAGEQTLTSAREAQRGFGTNTAALKAIQDNTTKQLNDLDKRKDQALLENNTAFADRLDNLKLKAIEFQQQAEQQTFSNILAVGGFELQIRAEDRVTTQFQQNIDLQRQQMDSTKQSSMMNLAANAGVALSPGETFESLSQKIANSDITSLTKQKLQQEITNLKKKDESNTYDLFANSIISREIANGATATDAASTAMFELVNLYGIEPSIEQRNNIINAALLLEQQRKDSVNQQMNNTANVSRVAENLSKYFTGGGATDKPTYEQMFALKQEEERKQKNKTLLSDKGKIDFSNIDFSKNINIPNSSDINLSIYDNLFGGI